MVFLQVSEAGHIQEYLLQYGVLGLLAFLLGYFAWMQYQRLVKKNDALEEKIDKLQDERVLVYTVQELTLYLGI